MSKESKSSMSFMVAMFFSVWLACFSFVSFGQTKEFRAGASTTNITPSLGEGIVGNFGIPPPAAHVHDELHVRTLVLDDGEKMMAFIVSEKSKRTQPEVVESEQPLEKTYANRVIQISEEWPDQISVILQAFSIGEVGIAAIPFEVFTEIGLEITSKSPFETTFTIALANVSHGYLATCKQHQLGGYETSLDTNSV